MLMVIFGAGASHGSVGEPPRKIDEEFRPPVTTQLFDSAYGDVADQYPAARPAIVRMQQALAANPDGLIEAEIAALGEEARTNPEQARHLLGLRFYLNDLIDSRTSEWWKRLHGFTYYGHLLQRLGRWRHEHDEQIALVTFNYDLLLDFTLLGQIGKWGLSSFEQYVSRDDWRLYKLHGSVAWSRVLKAEVGGPLEVPNVGQVIAAGDSLDFETGELRPRPWRKGLEAWEPPKEYVAAPGIAVPTNKKQAFSCPEPHVERFAEDAAEADRVLVIGWRASEPHALKILRDRMPRPRQLIVANLTRDESSEALNTLIDGGVEPIHGGVIDGGFDGLLSWNGSEHVEPSPVAGKWLDGWLTS